MSRTYHLVCLKTRQSVWIGQGTPFMLYSDDTDVVRELEKFLSDNKDKPLYFLDSEIAHELLKMPDEQLDEVIRRMLS